MTVLGLVWSGLGVWGRPHVALCRALDHVGRATFHVASRVILGAQFYIGQSVRQTRFHRQIVSSTLRCFIGRSFLRHLFHRCVIRRSSLRHSMLDRAYYISSTLFLFCFTRTSRRHFSFSLFHRRGVGFLTSCVLRVFAEHYGVRFGQGAGGASANAPHSLYACSALCACIAGVVRAAWRPFGYVWPFGRVLGLSSGYLFT